ncbi:MAG: iron ABC transporter permease [Lachnospiraceae bacterium]|nr:iron ABC transporter permease [Lachnospiraceae bacterium]
MPKERKVRYILAYVLLGISVVLGLICNICIGSVKISFSDIVNSFLGKEINETAQRILWEIRFPRAVAAVLLGGALVLSGYLLQTFFHNPIAGPFILGISSGAKMVVALVMVFFAGKSMRTTSWTMIFAAFIGAMISMGFVLLISNQVSHMSMLIVGGVMIGYICSAVTELVVTFASDAQIVNLHDWSRGSFSGTTWENVAVMAEAVLLTSVIVFFMSKPLSAYQLGEAYAKNMGVRLPVLRAGMVVLSGILSACVVAFAGPVSFVGIAVPHLVKSLLGTAKPLVMIPACFLGGSAFCLFCDLLARTAFAPTELSISTVTAVFGAPVVLWVMIRRKKEREA